MTKYTMYRVFYDLIELPDEVDATDKEAVAAYLDANNEWPSITDATEAVEELELYPIEE